MIPKRRPGDPLLAIAIKPEGNEGEMNLRAVPVTTLGFVVLLSGAAFADPRQDVLEAMGKCAALADGKDRLSCYDAVAPRLRDALNVPPEALSHPPTTEEQKSWFGFNLGNLFGSSTDNQTTAQQFGAERTPETQAKVTTAEVSLDSISAGVTDYSFTLAKKFIVFLDNGQVWRQISADTEVAHFSKTAEDNKVTIERGMLGSYNMVIDGSEKTYKVTRVK
ncbi:MAG TPA: hypothetical protein VIJ85_09370 [Rhizomicrobium sp.]